MMADDLSVAFERLRTSTQRLNSVCDVAAQAVRDIEAYLEEIQLGIEAYVQLKSFRDDESGERLGHSNLAYMKYGAKYRITITFVPEHAECPEDVSVEAWSEANRDEKIESVEKLPQLLAALAIKVDEKVARAERVVSDVTSKLPIPKKPKGGGK